jgi:hypothetical protein
MYKNWFSISNEDSYYFYSIRILKKIPVLTFLYNQPQDFIQPALWPVANTWNLI